MRRFLIVIGLAVLPFTAQVAVAVNNSPFNASPNSNDFGSVAVGNSSGSQQFTVTNADSSPHTINTVSLAGSNPLQFGIPSNNCDGATLDANGGANDSCTLAVRFSPTNSGAQSAQLDVDSGAGTETDIADLTGTGTVSLSVSVSPGSFSFPSQQVAAGGATHSFTVTNTGNGAVTVVDSLISASSSGAGFSQNDGCTGTVLASNGDQCTIVVTFDPTTAGNKTGTLQVDDSSGNPAHNVSLSGTATAPAVSAPDIAFGNVLLNHTANQTLTVTNSGSAPLVIGAGGVTLATGAGQYLLSNDTCSGQTIAVGNSCTVTVSFTPTVSGAHPGSVTIASNDPAGTATVNLTGNGLSQFVSITPVSRNFGSQTIGKTGATQVFTVTNLDSAVLNVNASPLTIVGTNPRSFKIIADGCAGQALASNATCTFTVQYTPGAAGALIAQLREADSAPDSPHTVSLTGTGVRPPSVTNLAGAVGCNAVTITWKPSTAAGVVGSMIRRSATHIPRNPLDGTRLVRTRVGVLLNGGLHHFHTYYYAIWMEYRFGAGHPIVYSARKWLSLHTGRVCRPKNHAIIFTTTPRITWLAQRGAFAYGLRIFQSGTNIFAWSKRTTRPTYLVRSSWVFRGVRRSLHKGNAYVIFVYAYTRTHPSGFLIGRSDFRVR